MRLLFNWYNYLQVIVFFTTELLSDIPKHDPAYYVSTGSIVNANMAGSSYDTHLNAIIIGAGPAGIAMAYQLKHQLGFEDFTVYEKLDGPGGTWRANTYPGW